MQDDFKEALNIGMKTKSDYMAAAMKAQNRIKWKTVEAKATSAFALCELRGERITKRRKARKASDILEKK